MDYEVIGAKATADGGAVTCPRVGHTASVVDDRTYVFGGGGGGHETIGGERTSLGFRYQDKSMDLS